MHSPLLALPLLICTSLHVWDWRGASLHLGEYRGSLHWRVKKDFSVGKGTGWGKFAQEASNK